jgi:S1-C subfamily serine protease
MIRRARRVSGMRGVIALAVVVNTVACGSSPDSGATDDRSAVRQAVLDVRANGCGPRETFGTASLVGDVHAVTAAHVVAGADDVQVIDRSGESHPADVVLFDPDLDLAVLSTTPELGVPLHVADEPVIAGATGVVGFARLEDGAVLTRVTDVTVLRHVDIDTTDIYRDTKVIRPGFEVEAAVDPGDSGGVVVVDGLARGVIWARSTAHEDRAWAIDLPDEVSDPSRLASLTRPVDTGPCVRRSGANGVPSTYSADGTGAIEARTGPSTRSV